MLQGEDVWVLWGDCMIKVKCTGNFDKTEQFIIKMMSRKYLRKLRFLGLWGVSRLNIATPVLTGKTAGSWKWEVQYDENGARVVYWNENVNDGANVALLLQYGHATKNGTWVSGYNYIEPALRPVFDRIAEQAWKVVTSS